MPGLSIEKIETWVEVYTLSYHALLLNYASGVKAIGPREKVIERYDNLIMTIKPYLFTTPEALTKLVVDVFTTDSEDLTDFVMSLSQRVFTIWGEGDADYPGLVENLVAGMAQAEGYLLLSDKTKRPMMDRDGRSRREPACFMPDLLRERYPKTEDTRDVLLANRWITLLLMGAIFGRSALVMSTPGPEKGSGR